MQFYRKTRRRFVGILIKSSIKIFVLITVLIIIIYTIGNLDLPAPNKIIKQEIQNEKFKVIK